MSKDVTKLRYVASKDADTIVQWVNSLPYKIEIKGQSVMGKKHYLWFVIPDVGKEIVTGDLD